MNWQSAAVAVAPTIAAVFAWLESRRNKQAIQEIHVKINSRMDQLLGAIGATQRAEGRAEGLAERNAGGT